MQIRAVPSWGLFLTLVAIATVGLLAAGCDDSSRESRPPAAVNVVTTIPLFADFVRVAGGDRVDVFTLVPAATNPHTFEPSPQELERLGEADLVLYNGLGLEAPFEDLLFENKRHGSQIVAFSRDVDSPTREGLTAFEAEDNAHLWLDPVLALTYIDTTWDSLNIVDGEAGSLYQENARQYKEQLRALNEEIAAKIDSIPPENRKLVTYHDSFVHFANRYGLEVIGVVAPDPAQEPSPGRLDDLEEAIRREGVPAVFGERGFGSELLEQLAADAGVRICTLYSDVLDDDVDTYIEMMRFNADELVDCLGGE